MANIYTFDQFEQEARKAGLYDQFSSADLNLARNNPDAGMSILKYKQDYANATTDEARVLANEGAEGIRRSYGNYTGGGDGGSFRLDPLSPSSFAPQQTPEYENQYAGQIKELTETLANREDFSYDPATDPVYGAYAKQYAREGQRATQDTLGAVAAASGGIPSSYAVTAASQAGDYYAAQMADKVPQLYQQAYDRYKDDFNMDLASLDALNTQEQLDYGKHRDKISQNNYENEFGYGQLLDELSSQGTDRSQALEKALLAAQMGDYSLLNQMGIDTSNNPTDYDRQYQLALLKAQYGDYSGLRALGVDTSTVDGGGGYSGGSGRASRTSGAPNPGNPDSGPGEELPAAPVVPEDTGILPDDTYNEILSKYPDKVIPQQALASLLLQHPGVTADKLKEEGFTIKDITWTAPKGNIGNSATNLIK